MLKTSHNKCCGLLLKLMPFKKMILQVFGHLHRVKSKNLLLSFQTYSSSSLMKFQILKGLPLGINSECLIPKTNTNNLFTNNQCSLPLTLMKMTDPSSQLSKYSMQTTSQSEANLVHIQSTTSSIKFQILSQAKTNSQIRNSPQRSKNWQCLLSLSTLTSNLRQHKIQMRVRQCRPSTTLRT